MDVRTAAIAATPDKPRVNQRLQSAVLARVRRFATRLQRAESTGQRRIKVAHSMGPCIVTGGQDVRAGLIHPALRREVGLAGARSMPRCPLEARIQHRRPSSRGLRGGPLWARPLETALGGQRKAEKPSWRRTPLGRSVALAPADQQASSAGVPGGPPSDSVDSTSGEASKP